MKVKLHGNDILCSEFIPSVKIGEFNSELTDSAKKLIVLNANFGQEFAEIYENTRNNLHIGNVYAMLQKMEDLFRKYDAKKFRIEHKIEWNV